MGAFAPLYISAPGVGGSSERICTRGKRMKNRRLFISIFAISLAVTLLVSPVKVFNNPVVETIQVQAEEEPITDTQRGTAILMTILLAQGLRFVGDWNNVVQPGLVKLWNDFTSATGNAVTLPMLVAGSSLALGYIRTSNTVNNAIANFTAWYKNTYSQPITGEVDISIPLGEPTYYPMNSCTRAYNRQNDYYWNVNSGVRVVAAKYADYYYRYAFVSTSPFRYSVASGAGTCVAVNTDASSYTVNGTNYYIYLVNSALIASWYINVPLIPETNLTNSLAVYYTYGAGAIADVSLESQSLELKDGYQLESDQAKLYDLAGITSLVSALSLTLENIDDLVRDIPLIYDTPWSLDYPDNPTYVDTPDDTIPWVDVPDSVIPADTPEYVPTIPSERDQYKVLGLDQVFPFSIPFDLYYLSQILVSDPETPEFQYGAVNPVNGNLLTIDVDLHDFDGVASIFRTCETVLFIAFLIWITRSLIRS